MKKPREFVVSLDRGQAKTVGDLLKKVKKPRQIDFVLHSEYDYSAHFEDKEARVSVTSKDPKHLRKIADWLYQAAAWLEAREK